MKALWPAALFAAALLRAPGCAEPVEIVVEPVAAGAPPRVVPEHVARTVTPEQRALAERERRVLARIPSLGTEAAPRAYETVEALHPFGKAAAPLLVRELAVVD